MHVFLIIVGILFALILLWNIKAVGWVLIFGIAYLLDNVGKVLWWIITSPFRLVWWWFTLPFVIIRNFMYHHSGLMLDFSDVRYFYRRGDWSIRTAKILLTVAAIAGIVAAVQHLVK